MLSYPGTAHQSTKQFNSVIAVDSLIIRFNKVPSSLNLNCHCSCCNYSSWLLFSSFLVAAFVSISFSYHNQFTLQPYRDGGTVLIWLFSGFISSQHNTLRAASAATTAVFLLSTQHYAAVPYRHDTMWCASMLSSSFTTYLPRCQTAGRLAATHLIDLPTNRPTEPTTEQITQNANNLCRCCFVWITFRLCLVIFWFTFRAATTTALPPSPELQARP